MSLISSMYSGASGLDAASLDLEVVGDNISNSGTIGFKRSRASFEDALSETLVGGAQLGHGTRLAGIRSVLLQGSLNNTGVVTDLAISGEGYFQVAGTHDGREGKFYTRDGQFTLDNQGRLVTQGGLRVQGFPADGTGALSPTAGDLAFGHATSSPVPTTNISLRANLRSTDPIPVDDWDPARPKDTSNFVTPVTIYDSLGAPHDVTVYYRRTGAGTWEWHALTDGGGIQDGTAGTAQEIAGGELTFDTNGELTDSTQSSDFNPNGATLPQALTFDFGAGRTGMTQNDDVSAMTFVSQDGFASGSLASVQIDTRGNIVGAFSNGQTRVMGQIAIATFSAPDQLDKEGGNLLSATTASGPSVVGAPGTGGRGSIASGALEQSNVDLATEFVRMMAAQRNFQANSKTITTADNLLGELIQLKR